MIVDRPRIMKQVTDIYINKVRFIADIQRIYIKSCGVKKIDWYTGAYYMEPVDIDQIIKDWLDEWKDSITGDIDSEEDTEKDKRKGKEQVDEKRKTLHEEQNLPKKMKTKAYKPTLDVHLGLDDYEPVVNRVQETFGCTYDDNCNCAD